MPFALSYNSQIWRQEGGRDWKLGHDIGYGAGWRLQAGSITPYWSAGSVHHYIFSDSSGAEYRLDVNTSGVWSSKEGIYIEYEPSTYRLYFPDGSFWVMGAVSAGTEQDSGARYPTVMEDTNGNQIVIRYQRGSAQQFDRRPILRGVLQTGELGLGQGHALCLQQEIAAVL